MTTYNNVFGGLTIPDSDASYASYTISSAASFYWPEISTSTYLIRAVNDINCTVASNITLPDATQVSTGRAFLIRNTGSATLGVLDNASGAVVSIAAGNTYYLNLTSNATAAGTWMQVQFGAGTSQAQASSLAGAGLSAISGLLNGTVATAVAGTSWVPTDSDRCTLVTYGGLATTIPFPDPATLQSGWFIIFKNDSSSAVTLSCTQLIDASATKTIQPGESLFIAASASTYNTYAYSRATEFLFSTLSVDLTGLTAKTITAAQAANKIWLVYNVPAGNTTVTIPSVVSVYFVRVSNVGVYTITFTTGSGATVALTANQSYILYCDGTNVVAAQTVGVAGNVTLDDGTAAVPSFSFTLDPDTGIYRPAANTLGITANGSVVAKFTTTGISYLAQPLPLLYGGTGASTQPTAANNILPSQAAAAGLFLISDGVNVSWAASSAYTATSTTSLTIGLGAQTLTTTPTGKSFTTGQPVRLTDTANSSNYMTGLITSYVAGTGAMVVNVLAISGSGTISSWAVAIDIFTLPSQTGNSGKVLTTDGTSASWQLALPDQTGNANKVLKTDGSTASWGYGGAESYILQSIGVK